MCVANFSFKQSRCLLNKSRMFGPHTKPLWQQWAYHNSEISFQPSGVSNFETHDNHLGPGLDCMAGDLTAWTCTQAEPLMQLLTYAQVHYQARKEMPCSIKFLKGCLKIDSAKRLGGS